MKKAQQAPKERRTFYLSIFDRNGQEFKSQMIKAAEVQAAELSEN